MRHNVGIMLGEDLKLYVARLAKYIHKYGEGSAAEYCRVTSWVKTSSGTIEIRRGELENVADSQFVSTTNNLYSTRLVDDKCLTAENRDLQVKRYFDNLHSQIVTVNNGGDNSSLLLTIYLPIYDADLCREAIQIITAINSISPGYSIMVVGLCCDMRCVIHSTEDDVKNAPVVEAQRNCVQRENIELLAKLHLEIDRLKQVIILQNTNAAGYSLNLDEDSFTRILGELSLLFVEKYDTIFSQSTQFDRGHPLCSIGMSVLNLDKYYFANYLLRRAYLHILAREGVGAEKVELNKVAVKANSLLEQHKQLFSNFYDKHILPGIKAGKRHDTIVANAASLLNNEFLEITRHLTEYISSEEYSLPEKKAMLAVILGYDDPLLSGNLFNQDQLTINNLDEQVANIFIEANNRLVKLEMIENEDGEPIKNSIPGPINACRDEDNCVKLPIQELQQLRNRMLESTNYIRSRNDEIRQIEKMSHDAVVSDRRLTKDGFIIDGTIFRVDTEPNEVEFEDYYQPQEVIDKEVDLRSYFTPIKSQGEIGACTAYAVVSIFEHILKKNTKKDCRLSESFVYYNARHAKGNENEDTGCSISDVIKSMGADGVCTEELFPYTTNIAQIPSERAYDDGKTRKILTALNVRVEENSIKSALQEGYPVAVLLKVFNSFSSSTIVSADNHVGAKGFVPYPDDSELASNDFGYHAMVIVGYNDDTQHFILRNSWGSNFGDGGYCYIPYAYICNKELNRMACIITEVYTASGDMSAKGGRGDSTIVKFDLSDAAIRACVIKSLLISEKLHLQKMQKCYSDLRLKYEALMQELGRQSVRNEIRAGIQVKLQKEIAEAKELQKNINEVERPRRLRDFDKNTLNNRLYLIVVNCIFFIAWIVGAVIFQPESSGISAFFAGLRDWFSSGWCYMILAIFVLVSLGTILYWSWIKSQRRRIEMELEERSAELALQVQKLNDELNENQLKFHIAGMVIDKLLMLKSTIDGKYQAMKSYLGNLSVWQSEETAATAKMDSLVKNPFIPLLNNDTLDTYFENNKDEITQDVHLYDYFNEYNLNEETIIAYKQKLKSEILSHLGKALEPFTIFRHIFNKIKYPYLDNIYASPERLLPLLEQKSEPFSRIRSNAEMLSMARFLFVNVDEQDRERWNNKYIEQFHNKPICEDDVSKYKIIVLSVQLLSVNELLLNDTNEQSFIGQQ